MKDDPCAVSFEEFGSDEELAAIAGGAAVNPSLLRSIGTTTGEPALVVQRGPTKITISGEWSRG